MQRPSDRLTITRERFDQLIERERACGDFVTMLLDLNQPDRAVHALAGIEASSPYVKGVVLAALCEAAKALNIKFSLPA